MEYRRALVPGGTFFFTVVTADRRPILANEKAVGVLREAFKVVIEKRPFSVVAMVVLPEHLHCLWTLPPGDSDFATRWQLIKTWFTKHREGLLGYADANPTYGESGSEVLSYADADPTYGGYGSPGLLGYALLTPHTGGCPHGGSAILHRSP